MSRNICNIDKGMYRNRRIVYPAYPTPVESYYPASPIELPTAEPATSQIIYTVTPNMLVNLNSNEISSYQWPIIIAGGINSNASSAVISYRAIKNGVSQATGTLTATPTGNYFTHCNGNFGAGGCVLGDIIEVRLWSSLPSVKLTYNTVMFHCSIVGIGKDKQYLENIVFRGYSYYYPLTSGASPKGEVGTANAYLWIGGTNYSISFQGITIPGLRWTKSLVTLSPYYNTNFASIHNDATYMPYYRSNSKFESIAYTPVNL